uniref:FBA_2 domain-containing protein n=1 Tax=Panagrellus redivivus TaxID=6233 RepID=A0A7E5A0M1_PANRE
MPFPLRALDYGSRCRLRELATPGEAYDLQTAAPHFDGLNPIQKVDMVLQSVKVFINNNNEFCANEVHGWDGAFGKPLKLNNNELYCVKETVFIENFTTDHSAQMIFDRFIFAPRRFIFAPRRHMKFKNCIFTRQFLQDISSKIKHEIEGLQFSQCRLHAGVSHVLICKLFKELKYLRFEGDFWNVDWFDTLVTLKYANMAMIGFYNVSRKILDFNQAQMIRFIKAQTEYFYVDILLNDDRIYGSFMIDRLFSERWCLKYSDSPRVFIYWQSHHGLEMRELEPRIPRQT